MRKVTVLLVVVALSIASYAGSFLVSVKMPDGSLLSFELPNVPTADANGMFRFHNKNGGDIIVHASNVWIIEKNNKAKVKGKEKR